MTEASSTLPLIGTSEADVLRAQASVTFVWVPLDYKWSLAFPLDPNGSQYAYKRSTAFGEITVNGVSPSESVDVQGKLGDSFYFRFTNETVVSGRNLSFNANISWDQFLDSPSIREPFPYENYTPKLSVDASRTVAFGAQETDLYTNSPGRFVPWQVEFGHWQLLDESHDVYVAGGAGDDTIYGGQGNQTLVGGAGRDVIHVGPGNSHAEGGAGNDTIWGGRGDQILDGGAGDDTLYVGAGGGFVSGGAGNDVIYGAISPGGIGNQTLEGGAGNDLIFGGTGNQTLFGDAGADTLYAGDWSDQRLDGGAGNDVLTGGLGHDTFVGGAGRDTFVLLFTGYPEDFLRAIEVENFRPGQDIVELRTPSNVPINNPVSHLSSAANGDAMLSVNGGTIVLHGARTSDVAANPTKYLLSVADLSPYDPGW